MYTKLVVACELRLNGRTMLRNFIGLYISSCAQNTIENQKVKEHLALLYADLSVLTSHAVTCGFSYRTIRNLFTSSAARQFYPQDLEVIKRAFAELNYTGTFPNSVRPIHDEVIHSLCEQHSFSTLQHKLTTYFSKGIINELNPSDDTE